MATRRRPLPALPKSVFSVLGAFPVSISPDLDTREDALGITRWRERVIEIHDSASRETQWQTLFHEMAHVAMWDGGCHDALSHEQLEAVCNALGTYLCAAMRDGYVRLTAPRRSGAK